MCESMIDQLAAIHLVDLDETGLEAIGDGSHYLEHEISHWSDEIQRVQRGPLPASSGCSRNSKTSSRNRVPQ